MKAKISLSFLALVFIFGVSLYFTAKVNQKRRELSAKECGAFKALINKKIDILGEKARLEEAGLEVSFLQDAASDSGSLWVSSSKLDFGQVGCHLEVVSGAISSVQ